jgi:hypothetical protein
MASDEGFVGTPRSLATETRAFNPVDIAPSWGAACCAPT